MKTARKLRARARKVLRPLVPTRWRTSPQPSADQVSQNAQPRIDVVAPTPTGTPLTASPHHSQEAENALQSPQLIQPQDPSQDPSSASVVSDSQPSAVFDVAATTNSLATRLSAVTEDPKTWEISLSKVDTAYVYAVTKPRPAVYVAIKGCELDVPAPIKTAYERNMQQDLDHQLGVVHDDLMNKRDEKSSRQSRPRVCQNAPRAKLEMSGLLADDGSLTLRPAIRIECDEGTTKEIRAAVNGHGFRKFRDMPDFSDIRFHVVKGPRGISATGHETKDSRMQSPGLDGFDGNFDVEFHLGFLPSESAAQGAVCRTTLYHNGVRIALRYTRVGGVLDVDGCSMCVTTAHQIFDGLAQELYGPLPTESDDEDGDDDPDTYDGDASMDHGCKTFPSADFTQITKWTRASLGAGAFYGGLYIKPAMWKRSRIVIRRGPAVTSDFAVLHLGRLHRKKFAGKLRSVSPTAPNIDTATTQVLLGGSKMCRAFPCPDKDRVSAYGRHVRTTLLGLDYALPPGSSGAWVVKGGDCLGMIIAGYDGEPLAHMISAEDLIADVRTAISGKVLAFRSSDDLLSSHRRSRISRFFLPQGQPRAIQSSQPTSTATAPILGPSRRKSALDSCSSDNSNKRLGALLNAAPITPLEALNIRGHPRPEPTSAPDELGDLQLFNIVNTRTHSEPEISYARTILDEDLASVGAEAASTPRVLIDSTRFRIPESWVGMVTREDIYASTTATIPSSISTRTTPASTISTDPTSISTEPISSSNETTLIDAEATSPPTVSNRSKILRFSYPSSSSRKNDEPWVERCSLRSSRSLPVVNDSETHIGVPSSTAANETHTTECLPDNQTPVKQKDQRTSPSRIRTKLLRHILTRYETEARGKNKKYPVTTCSAEETLRVHGPHELERAVPAGERFGWRLDDDRSPVLQDLYRTTSALRKAMDSSSKRQLPLVESILLRHAKWDILLRLLSLGVDVQYLDLVDPLRLLKQPWTCTHGSKRELFLESRTVSASLAARLLEHCLQKEDVVNLMSTFKILQAMRGFRWADGHSQLRHGQKWILSHIPKTDRGSFKS